MEDLPGKTTFVDLKSLLFLFHEISRVFFMFVPDQRIYNENIS
jgi:hypothetical protein